MKLRNAFLAIVAAIVLSALVLPGCTKPTGTEAGLGKEFSLSIGQSATVTGENLSVKFIEVVSDSRCPTGATCIWAGEASSLVEITTSGSTYSKVLTQPGLSGPSQTDFLKYQITYNLQPYPQAGREAKKGDYSLHLIFNMAPTPGGPGGGALVNSDSVVTAKIQAIRKQASGYPWELDVLIENSIDVGNLPNPTKDSIGKVITVKTDQDMNSYKVGNVVNAKVKYVGDVPKPGITLYMYDIVLEIHP